MYRISDQKLAVAYGAADKEKLLKRLRVVRSVLGYSQQFMGEKMGLAKSSYSSVELGKNRFTPHHLMVLKNNLGVNPWFLVSGEDPMFLDNRYPEVATIPTVSDDDDFRDSVIRRIEALELDVRILKKLLD